LVGANLLLEKDGSESGVESTNTLSAQDLGETRDQTGSKGGLGHKTNTGSFERAKGDIGEELSAGGGGQVDGSPVVGGSLIAQCIDPSLLEEFITAELESALKEISGKGGTDTRQQGAGAFGRDDLTEATDEATVIGDGIELDAGLDSGEILRSASVLADKGSALPRRKWRARAQSGWSRARDNGNGNDNGMAMAGRIATGAKLTHRRESGRRE